MKVLVTGSTGFLGKHVVAELKERGHEVIGFGRQGEFFSRQYDLTVRSKAKLLIKWHKPEVVIHLAATVGGIGANVKYSAKFWRDNLYMGLNIIDACALKEYVAVHEGEHPDEREEALSKEYPLVRRLIVAGTTCSYPEKPAKIPFPEEELWNGYPEPTNAPYGIAKRALIAGCMAYRKELGKDFRVLMPTNLYGPGDHLNIETNHVIPALIIKFIKARKWKDPYVELWGDGSATRDFLYVKDAAKAFADAVESDTDWDLLNLGTGKETSIKDLAELIKKYTNYEGDIAWTGELSGQPRRALDCSKARKLLYWRPSVTLRKGLKETIKWIKPFVKKRGLVEAK